MKDYLGNKLEIGDECVLIEPNYRNFVKASIVSFTPQNVQLVFDGSYTRAKKILQAPSQLVKIIKEAA